MINKRLAKPQVFCLSPKSSDPGGIQTHDLQNRNLMLYSAKLQGLITTLPIATAKIAIIYKETIVKITKKRKEK